MLKKTQKRCRARHAWAGLGLLTLLVLAACGGGGGESALGVAAAAPSTGASASNPAPGNTPTAGLCPRAQLADAWINNRLGCATVGQRLIDLSGSAAGLRSDTAFVIRQQTLDAGFNNVLGGNVARHFRHFLCVRNAPAGLTEGLNRLSLATDLSVAIGTSNSSTRKPPQVSAVTLEVAGGNGPGWVNTICDPAVHPLIVDFTTGLVQSVNPAALAALQTFDQ